MTAQTEHSQFPTDETLAAYIDGGLDEETRSRVAEHLADCAECFEAVQVRQEMAAAAPAEGRVVQWPRNALVGLAAAAAVGAVLFLTPLRDRVWPHDDIGALAAVAPPKRVIDGRLTRFPYRERAVTYRSGNTDDDSDLESLEFRSVAIKVENRATEHPNARTLHAEGLAYLTTGDKQQAIKALETALNRSSSPDPQLLSDLAAAYIAVGRYQEALDTANRAWGMAQTPEIAWNRAFASQRLEHRAEAIAAWNKYLELDHSSAWVPEAKHNLEDVISK